MRFFGGKDSAASQPSPAMVRELQMSLEQAEIRVRTLMSDLERERRAHVDELAATSDAARAELIDAVSRSLVHLAMIRDMVEAGRDIPPDTVTGALDRLLSSLARSGVAIDHHVGESVHFDPLKHQRMGDGRFTQGADVVVRVPGLRYAEQQVVKASVEETD